MKKLQLILTCSISLVLIAAAQGQTEVTPSNMNGWSFWSLNGAYTGPQAGSVGAMVTGPAAPPLGTGSAELSTVAGGGDGGVGITTGAYDGMNLSSLTALSYSAYSAVNNGQQFPYLALNVNLNLGGVAGAGGQDTLFFEPPYQTPAASGISTPDQGPTVMNEWQSWNALTGFFWDNNGVLGYGGYGGVNTLADFEAADPYATIADSDSPFGFIDGVTLQVGFGSPGETYTGYVDDVTINSTTYDFDPAGASAPDNASTSVLFIIALAAFGGFRLFTKQAQLAK